MPEETESLLPDFTLRGETSPGVRKGEVLELSRTLTQHHFLWDHSVTSSIKGTVAMPFSQWISNWRSHSLPEWGLEELKQGANTSLWCLPQVLFTSSYPSPKPTNQPAPRQRIQIGQKLENTVLLTFHSGLYDCKVFYFPLKQCFYEMPQIKKSK